MFSQGLIPKIYKELIQLSKKHVAKSQITQFEWAEELSRHFAKRIYNVRQLHGNVFNITNLREMQNKIP